MEISWGEHAKKQLGERKLNPEEIHDAIIGPDRTILQSSGRYRAIKKIRRGNKIYLLIVIYEVKDYGKEIVTAFITSKIKKYLPLI